MFVTFDTLVIYEKNICLKFAVSFMKPKKLVSFFLCIESFQLLSSPSNAFDMSEVLFGSAKVNQSFRFLSAARYSDETKLQKTLGVI